LKVSIIIPVLNEASTIRQLVNHFLTNLSETFEIIVVDGGSYDKTIEICKQLPVQLLTSKPSRAIQQNTGAKAAKYEYLYFVHSDTLPPKSVEKDLKKCIKSNIEAACYRSSFDTPSLLMKVNAFFTRFNFLVCRGGDQSLFINKKTFFDLGGFDESLVIMEEYPLIQKLMDKKLLHVIPKAITISARKYENRGWLKVNKANYKAFKLYRAGTDSKIIQKTYLEALNK
jgi:rSAM/selenodomain-associated transferase 2